MGGGHEKALDKERIAKGSIFMKKYTIPSQSTQTMSQIDENIVKCKARLRRLELNSGTAEQIKEARDELDKCMIQKDVLRCKVALQDKPEPVHQLGLEEYLEQLLAELTRIGGVEPQL